MEDPLVIVTGGGIPEVSTTPLPLLHFPSSLRADSCSAFDMLLLKK